MQREELHEQLTEAVESIESRVHDDDHGPYVDAPADTPQRRELWEGPDGVLIEEGLPQFGQSPHPPRTVPPPLGEQNSGRGFTPAAPTPLRRAGRRMPDLQDFPPVGQREYRAKTGQYPDESDHGPRAYGPLSGDQQPRKRSLLQRLVSASRGRGEGGE
jgi:cell division protein FtsZ